MSDENWDDLFSQTELIEMSEISNQIIFNAEHRFRR